MRAVDRDPPPPPVVLQSDGHAACGSVRKSEPCGVILASRRLTRTRRCSAASSNNPDNLTDKSSRAPSFPARAEAILHQRRSRLPRSQPMESMMLEPDLHVRRRDDGSIDIDFYRQKGLMERRAVMTRFFDGRGRMKKGLIGAAIIATALYFAPSRDGTSSTGDGVVAGTTFNHHAPILR
jgi:hypothetical protein